MSVTPDTNETTGAAYRTIRIFHKQCEWNDLNKGRKAEPRVVSSFHTLCVLAWVLFACIPLAYYTKRPLPDLIWCALFCILWMVWLIGLFAWDFKLRIAWGTLQKEYQSAKYMVLHSHSPDVIPALLELMETEDNKAYVTQALIRLLPSLDSQNVNLIGARQYRVLYDLLLHFYVLELRITIVHTLGKIGNQDTFPILNTVSQEPDLPEVLQEAIQQCRAEITEREQQAQSQQMLLRASENIQPPETLLRAAQPVSQTLSDNLLRANYSDMDVKQIQQQGRKER